MSQKTVIKNDIQPTILNGNKQDLNWPMTSSRSGDLYLWLNFLAEACRHSAVGEDVIM